MEFKKMAEVMVDGVPLGDEYDDEEYYDDEEEEEDEVEGDEVDVDGDGPRRRVGRPRADVLAKYPFKDEATALAELLHHDTGYATLAERYLAMGPNARKRAATQVFQDLCAAGAKRLARADVEAALTVLGLARPMDQDAVDRRVDLLAASGIPDIGLTLDQWLAVVARCVQLEQVCSATDSCPPPPPLHRSVHLVSLAAVQATEQRFRQSLADQQRRILHQVHVGS